MPKINIPQPKVKPTTVVANQQQQIPAGLFDKQFAAGRRLAGAIGQLGQVAADEAIKTLQWQGREETQRGKDDYDIWYKGFKADKLSDGNYSAYTQRFADGHKAFTSERLKQVNHKGALANVEEYYKNRLQFNGIDVQTESKNALVKQTRADWDIKKDLFADREVRANTPEEMKNAIASREEYINEGIATGVWPEEERERLNNEVQQAKAELMIDNMITALALEEGWDAAVKFLDDPELKKIITDQGVDPKFVDDVLPDIVKKANRARAEGVETLKNQQLDESNDFVKRMDTTDIKELNLLHDDIQRSSLFPTGVNGKASWLAKVDALTDSILTGKDNPFNQSNPAFVFELRRKIAVDPTSVTEPELADLVGKGKGGEIRLPTPEEQKADALTGELGKVKESTEISITVTDSRLNDGKPTNIPTLVKGQVDVEKLAETLKPTNEQQEIAIKRAAERVSAGAALPSFETIEQAVEAAKARSDAKGKGGISRDNYDTLLALITDATNPLNTNSAKRAQKSIEFLRDQEIKVELKGPPRNKEELAKANEITERSLKISDEYDAYLLSEEGLKATDEQKRVKLTALKRPVIEEVVLGGFVRFISGKAAEEKQLISLKLTRLREQPVFQRFTEAEQQQAIELVRSGSTLEQAVSQIEDEQISPAVRPTTQAEFEAIPVGTAFIDTDGVRKVKQ